METQPTNHDGIDPNFVLRLKDLGGSDLVEQLINMFLSKSPQLVATIKRELEAQNYSAAQDAAHSLISSAGNLGGVLVSTLARQIENALIEDQIKTALDLESDLDAAHETFQLHIKHILEQL